MLEQLKFIDTFEDVRYEITNSRISLQRLVKVAPYRFEKEYGDFDLSEIEEIKQFCTKEIKQEVIKIPLFIYYSPTGKFKLIHNGPKTERDISVFLPQGPVNYQDVINKSVEISNLLLENSLKVITVTEIIFIKDKPSVMFSFILNHDKEINKKDSKEFIQRISSYLTELGCIIR